MGKGGDEAGRVVSRGGAEGRRRQRSLAQRRRGAEEEDDRFGSREDAKARKTEG